MSSALVLALWLVSIIITDAKKTSLFKAIQTARSVQENITQLVKQRRYRGGNTSSDQDAAKCLTADFAACSRID